MVYPQMCGSIPGHSGSGSVAFNRIEQNLRGLLLHHLRIIHALQPCFCSLFLSDSGEALFSTYFQGRWSGDRTILFAHDMAHGFPAYGSSLHHLQLWPIVDINVYVRSGQYFEESILHEAFALAPAI
jgi:hypothetical protein